MVLIAIKLICAKLDIVIWHSFTTTCNILKVFVVAEYLSFREREGWLRDLLRNGLSKHGLTLIALSEKGYVKVLSMDMDIQITPGPINTVLVTNISRQGDSTSQTRVYSRQDLLTLRTPRSENKPNFFTVGILKYYGIYEPGKKVAAKWKYHIIIVSSSSSPSSSPYS